jgi:hypothetical protein
MPARVDIVPQKYLDGPLRPNPGELMVDCRKDLCELLGASINIADRVDANSIGQSRFAMLSRLLPGAPSAPWDRWHRLDDEALNSAGLSNGE